MFHRLTLPKYDSIKHLEGKGYAIRKYYKWPYRYFYRHKLHMMAKLLPGGFNVLDFGSGPARIFSKELSKRYKSTTFLNKGDTVDPRWRFSTVLCGSVLEFAPLQFTIKMLSGITQRSGYLVVGSPIRSKASSLYYYLIKDKEIRHSHNKIIAFIKLYYEIEEYQEWLGLYFALRARKK